jgi:hypothetical protein
VQRDQPGDGLFRLQVRAGAAQTAALVLDVGWGLVDAGGRLEKAGCSVEDFIAADAHAVDPAKLKKTSRM